ncbi:DNA polymerase-3 subunit beta [Streptomyces sp. V4I8]|uniref:DNA polymerase III subunit beta n=1 Tax=Streptomyces sp. V4I8 TaxID=3156469 RepID=UPI003513B468
MRATTPQAELAAAAKWAARQAPNKAANPVLLGARLEAGDDQLRISVWDGATAAHATLTADVEEPGVIVASAQMLADITGSLRKSDVTLAGDHSLTVTTPAAEFNIPGIDPHTYPALPGLPGTHGTVDGGEFATAYQRVHRAIDPKASGSFAGMAGIRLRVVGDQLMLSATDRFRIATAWLPWRGDGEAAGLGVLPSKVMADNARTFDGALQIALPEEGEGTAALITENRAVSTLLIEPGLFPHKVDTQVPTQFTGTITGDASELAAAVQAAMTVSDGTLLWINTNGSDVTLRAGRDASSRITVDAQYDGDHSEFEMAINADFLTDGLTPIAGQVHLNLTTPITPALIEPVDEDGYRYAVVPIRDPAKAAA